MPAAAPALPNPLPPDSDRGPTYLAVLVVGLTLSIVFIALRIYVRARMVKNLWWDDWFMLISFPFILVNCGLSFASLPYGVGRHIFYLQPLEIMNALKYNAIAQIFNILAFYFIKASIVLFLLRLITHLHMTMRYVLWVSLGLLTLVNIEAFVVSVAQCQPFAKQYNPLLPGTCWNRDVFQNSGYALAGVTIATDLVYLILPVVYLWDLQVPPRKKVAIFALLGIGCVSLGCTITSLPWVKNLATTQDVTYEIIPLACVKTAELHVAVWVGCIPAMQPLFRKLFGPGTTMPDPDSNLKDSHRLLKIKQSYGSSAQDSMATVTVKSEYKVIHDEV